MQKHRFIYMWSAKGWMLMRCVCAHYTFCRRNWHIVELFGQIWKQIQDGRFIAHMWSSTDSTLSVSRWCSFFPISVSICFSFGAFISLELRNTEIQGAGHNVLGLQVSKTLICSLLNSLNGEPSIRQSTECKKNKLSNIFTSHIALMMSIEYASEIRSHFEYLIVLYIYVKSEIMDNIS